MIEANPKRWREREAERKLAMGKRYKELKDEGKSGQEATDFVNEEFKTNAPSLHHEGLRP